MLLRAPGPKRTYETPTPFDHPGSGPAAGPPPLPFRTTPGGYVLLRNIVSGKATSRLGIVIAGFIIDFLQFPRGVKPDELPTEMVLDLGIAIGIVIPLLYLIPAVLFSVYRPTRSEHQRIHEAPEKRRERARSGVHELGEIVDLQR